VLLAQLNVQGTARELAKNCVLESFADGRMTLNLLPQHKLLNSKMAQERLQAALSDYFAQPVKLMVVVGAAANSATPAAVEQQERKTRHEQAVVAITQDPFVREAQAELGAQLIEDSIKPI
jgi:DNA polymerase-3 subunit gamma/tau